MPDDEQRPLFTIVTPSLNAERTIERTILSVKRQVDADFGVEHIVIDGKSSDGTLAVLGRHGQVRWISERDQGIYDAMNKGINLAAGQVIGILNTDDWYAEDTLSRVARRFREDPAVEVVHGDLAAWEGGRMAGVLKPKAGSWRKLRRMPVFHPTVFVKREVYERWGVFNPEYRITGDYDLMRRFQEKGVVFSYVPGVLSNFSRGGSSLTSFAVAERIRVRVRHGVPLPAAVVQVSYIAGRILYRRARKRLGSGRCRRDR